MKTLNQIGLAVAAMIPGTALANDSYALTLAASA